MVVERNRRFGRSHVAKQQRDKNMKRQLIILAIASALALGSLGSVDAQGTDDAKGKKGGHGHHGGWAGGNSMEHMTEQLNLTPDQQAKVQPLVDKATPEITAIHRQAMQKTKAIMDRTMIRFGRC